MLFYIKEVCIALNVQKLLIQLTCNMPLVKNGRNMKRGTCIICGTTKTQFIRAQKGGSLLNKAINKLPFEMHLPDHNFTGPGTKLKKQLNPDFNP